MVVGITAGGMVLPKLAEQLLSRRHQRHAVAAQVEALVEARPLHKVLTSMPRYWASGPAPASSPKWQASTSPAQHGLLRRDRPSHDPALRHVHSGRAFEPAREQETQTRPVPLHLYAALHHPPSRAYYDRKRAEGKRYNQASSPSHAADQMSSSPCSETERSTRNQNHETCHQRLDETVSLNVAGPGPAGRVGVGRLAAVVTHDEKGP